MDLVLTGEQKQVRDGANLLFKGLGGPSRLRAARDGGGAAGASDAWKQIAGLGWIGMAIPERLGGIGLGLAELVLVAEAAGRALAPEPLIACGVLAPELIAADDRARVTWLAPILAGDKLAAVAWDERTMRGDPARAAATANAVEGGGFVVDGDKVDVIAGASADVLLVTARLDHTLEVFAVDPATPGVTITAQRRVDGLPAARVRLVDVRLPAAARLASDDRRFEHALDRATVVAAAELLGVASAAFEMTLAYLRDRHQFGVAIGTFQALRHRAARMYIELELARSSVMAAARLFDEPASGPRLVRQTVSLAKARANDAALLVADESIQMHGGIGMTDEHDIGLYFKRARVLATTYGDSAHHRDRWARLADY